MIVLLSDPRVPRSFAAAGLGYSDLLTELIEVALAGVPVRADARVSLEGGRFGR